MVRKLVLVFLVGAVLPAFTCSKRIPIDMMDVEVHPPSPKQLEIWQREFDSGTTWRGDPKRLAHVEIQSRLDVPWKGEVFDPDRYEFTENNPEKPAWGSYAIRRYVDASGRAISYQVQMSKHRSIWYARKVRHYYAIEMAHPALQDKETRRH